MLDKNERRLKRIARTSIAGGLPPSLSLLEDLLDLLNRTRGLRGKRIVVILERMQEIEKMTAPIQPEEPMIVAESWRRTAPKKYKLHWEIEKARAILQRELSRYRFSPHAEVVMGGGGLVPSQWAIWWKSDSSAMHEKHLRMTPSEALEMILKLTQLSELNRLRCCMQCNQWLFARFRHQKFCSIKCQQRNFAQTPEWKEHRRDYMRRRYHLLKQHPQLKRKHR